jgi:uridine kinase
MKTMFKNISTSAILSQKDDLVISSENTNFEIKTLNTKEDLEVLKQIYDDGSLNLNDENNYINKIWKQSEEQNRYFIVSLVDSKPVGFAASYYTDIRGGTYFLSELYVNKNFRKQGVGHFLVKKVIKFSTQKGYTITTTQTEHDNIPAQKLYAKIGFKPVNNENTQHLTLQIENDLIWAVDKFIKTITETVKSPAVFITCGKAFSGKTYLSKLLAKEIQAERFSYDEIWLEIRQTVETENDRKLDFLNILEIIKERSLSALAKNKSVIIDTLFDTKQWRNETRKHFKDKDFEVWTIYTKISDQIQQDRIIENKISKERHQVNEKLLEEFNQKFEEPNDEDNVFVFECENLKSRVGNRELNPNKITFRQADLSDITGILAVQKKSMIDAFVGERYGITLEMVEQDFVGKETRLAKYFETGTYFVAENTEKIVGVIAASEDRILRTMWVDPDFQRQGIGRKLMLMAIQKLGSFDDIRLETGLQKNRQAVKFYESLGFEKTGKESRIKFFSEQTGEVENIEFVLKKDKIEQILQKYQEKSLADLVSLIEMKAKNKTDKPFIIAIDGRGGSGKSTLAEKIAQNFKTQIIKTDDFITFYKPEEITDKDYYWDKSRFIQDVLIPLKNKQDFQYDICRWKTGELVREEKIDLQNELIIIEGLHALHQDLLNFYDLKIWVNTPLEVSLERGKVRDLQKGKENIDELWNFFVPVQEKYISEHKPDQKADLVVSTENDGYEIVGKPKDEIEDKENTDFQIKILNTKEDLEVLKQIYNDESLNLQDENNYINKIWNKKEKQDSYFIICLIGSKPAGFAASLYYDDMVGGTYFLSELYVNKNFRKQGVGQFLVKKVIEFASRKRYKVTTTQTEQDNIPAQKLYNKIGFKPVKNEYTQHLTLQIKNDLVLSEGEKLESKIEKVENKYAPVGAVPKERGSYEMFPDLLNSIQEKAKNSNLDQKHQNNIDFLKKELVKVKNLELKNTSIEFFASGQCNDLYLITKNDKKYLARITNWEQNKVWKIKQEEYEKLNFIKDLKIAPTSHYYDLGQNEKQIHWCLVDFVEGKTVQQLSDKNITQLALTLKKLHENTIKNKYGDRWFELEDIPYKPYTLKEYSENKPKFVQKAGYDELKKSFEKINWAEIKKFCLIHNDLKPLNMVENNGEILLIDWEYSYMDIPENDIARFFVENSLTEIQKKLFLENYLPLENLDFTMEILQVFVDLYEFFEVREDVVEPVYNLAQSTKPFIIAIDGRGW